MQTLNANEAKTHFGDMILKVQKSPITINKNGKPVAVIQSIEDYNEVNEMKKNLLKIRYKRALEEIEKNNTVDGERLFNEIISGKYD